MRRILTSVLLLLTAMSAIGDVYLEYSQEMTHVLLANSGAPDLIRILTGENQIILYAGGSLGGKQVPLNLSADNPLHSCYSENRLDDSCNENDLLERSPSVDASSWFGFLRELTSNQNENESTAIILTGISGHLSYVVSTLRVQREKFYLLAYEVKNSPPLIYISIGELKNDSQVDKDRLIGIFPFNLEADQNILCAFDCTRTQEYLLLEDCIQRKINGIVASYEWQYPSKPRSPDYLECPKATFPPRPDIDEEENDKLIFPYTTASFYSEMKACWETHGIKVDSSQWTNPNIATEIKIKSILEVSSVNMDGAINNLPEELLLELKEALGDEGENYPPTTKRDIFLTFSGCD